MAEPLRVLVVEDSPADLLLIEELLQEAPGEAIALESADRLATAAARLRRAGIDLVILDLGLPDSQGLETFRALRAAAPRVPVIVLSGNQDDELAMTAVREGAQDYLVKGQAGGQLVARAARYAVERRRAEEEIRRLNTELEARVAARTRELEHANRELESFAYSVSHDLRSPLRAIGGFTQILLAEHAAQLDEAGRDALRRVHGGVERMARLIDDILRLSRVSRAELQRRSVDLGALAREIAAEIRGAEPARAVAFEIPDGLAAEADPGLVRILLANLLRNAWKFTRDNAAARIAVGARRGGGETAFFVRDDGVGFDAAHAEKLFGAFQRFHDPRRFEGTGIGLAIVGRIVQRHGGRIWAESAPGLGATFFFTLAPDGVPGSGPAGA